MSKPRAIIFALLATAFYAVNVPLSKLLLAHVGETTMAALLYLGAGVGIGIFSLFNRKDSKSSEKLGRSDLPYVIGMIVLDILAPILLMLGISRGSSANASLLGNFEIVATTVIALALFREKVSGMLWTAIALITLSSIISISVSLCFSEYSRRTRRDLRLMFQQYPFRKVVVPKNSLISEMLSGE